MIVVVFCMSVVVRNWTTLSSCAGRILFHKLFEEANLEMFRPFLKVLPLCFSYREQIRSKSFINIYRRSGAIGSRLTGAGWGGCAVSLVPGDVVESFMSQVKDSYYAKSTAMMAKVNEALFSHKAWRWSSCLPLKNRKQNIPKFKNLW